jgi:putative transcriptional regulator
VEYKSKKYRSPAMAAVHQMMSELHEAGVIDKVNIRHFDEQCLTPIEKMTGIRDKPRRSDRGNSGPDRK